MILVVLGTHELPFTRLLNEVERMKCENIIKEDVIVQHGHTKFSSNHMVLKQFVSYKEMDQLYDQARVIVTHAGTGSVISGLRKGKSVIAAARLKKYGEHNDDHQLELVSEFVKQGHILCWNDGDSLEHVFQQAETFEPKPFNSGKQKMFRLIKSFIEEA